MRKTITIYRCRFSGKEFRDREKFREHLLGLRQEHHRKYTHARWLAGADAFCAGCGDLNTLETWLVANLPIGTRKLKSCKFSAPMADDCSNSHGAPRGLPTNRGGRAGPDVPRSYPGISCRISFEFAKMTKREECPADKVSNLLRHIGIHTGTGGGGDGRYRYDCIIWAQHFPKLYSRFVADRLARYAGWTWQPTRSVVNLDMLTFICCGPSLLGPEIERRWGHRIAVDILQRFCAAADAFLIFPESPQPADGETRSKRRVIFVNRNGVVEAARSTAWDPEKVAVLMACEPDGVWRGIATDGRTVYSQM